MARRWFRWGRGRAATVTTDAGPSRPAAQAPHPNRPSIADVPAESRSLVGWIKTLSPDLSDHLADERHLSRLLDDTSTAELQRLDLEVRLIGPRRSEPWESFTVADAELVMSRSQNVVAVAAGLSMHRNGFVREAAVHVLAASDDPRALRWLLLRSADWVEPVRVAATAAVARWLAPHYADLLVDALPILQGDRFGPARRSNGVRVRVQQVLSEPSSRPAVEAGVVSSVRPVRRACVGHLVAAGADTSLLERVVETNDPGAIRMVADALATSGPVNRRTGEILLRSPMPRFRAEGLWRLTKDDAAGSDKLVMEALADRALSVREVAQRWLSSREQDPASLYRAMLDTDPVSGLLGLGDQADSTDRDAARRFLADDRRSVRLAALRLLAQVGSPADGALFAERFVGGGGKERRYAIAGLRRAGVRRRVDEIWDGAIAAGDPQLIVRVMRQLLPAAGHWKRIDIGLQASAHPDPSIREAGADALRRVLEEWNRGYPGEPDDLELLRRRFEHARPFLDADPRSVRGTRLTHAFALLLSDGSPPTGTGS